MAGLEESTCGRCGQVFGYAGAPNHPPPDCATCTKLGDRSLVWYTKAMRDATSDEEREELRRRFAAAEGRSWMRSDIERALERGGIEALPPGVLQLARERRTHDV